MFPKTRNFWPETCRCLPRDALRAPGVRRTTDGSGVRHTTHDVLRHPEYFRAFCPRSFRREPAQQKQYQNSRKPGSPWKGLATRLGERGRGLFGTQPCNGHARHKARAEWMRYSAWRHASGAHRAGPCGAVSATSPNSISTHDAALQVRAARSPCGGFGALAPYHAKQTKRVTMRKTLPRQDKAQAPSCMGQLLKQGRGHATYQNSGVKVAPPRTRECR